MQRRTIRNTAILQDAKPKPEESQVDLPWRNLVKPSKNLVNPNGKPGISDSVPPNLGGALGPCFALLRFYNDLLALFCFDFTIPCLLCFASFLPCRASSSERLVFVEIHVYNMKSAYPASLVTSLTAPAFVRNGESAKNLVKRCVFARRAKKYAPGKET